MTTRTTLLVIAAASALCGGAAFAEDDTSNPANTAPHRRGPMLRHPAAAEMKAYHEKVLAIYDADKDGTLDEVERGVLHDDIAAGEFEPPPAPPGRRGPPGMRPMGPPKEIVEKYDANKDGRLDKTERDALHADIEAGKVEMPRPRHGHGPGPRRGERPPPPPPGCDEAPLAEAS